MSQPFPLRIALVLAPLPGLNAAPYVGQLYLAAALLRAGHDVRAYDLAATADRAARDRAIAALCAWKPAIVGLSIVTLNALESYALLPALRESGALLLAGGAHASACASEVLAQGFDAVLRGEGEDALCALAEAVGRGEEPRGDLGFHSQLELDALPFAHEGLPAFRHDHAGAHRCALANELVASRGCPGRCRFCANTATGRRYRHRSAASVVAEMEARRALGQGTHFGFLDDAVSASRAHTLALCAAFASLPWRPSWSANVPPWSLRCADLEQLARAGCRSITIGIESGDPEILRAFGRPVPVRRLVDFVAAAHAAGLNVVTNWMVGFPGEGLAQLERTFQLMEQLAPWTSFMNQGGVLVPYPGTEVYRAHHAAFAFTRWWLDSARRPGAANDAREDPALAVDFFRYAPEVRRAIEAIVRYKAEHNEATLRRLQAEAAASTASFGPGARS